MQRDVQITAMNALTKAGNAIQQVFQGLLGSAPRRRRSSATSQKSAEVMEVRVFPAATLSATLTSGVLKIEGTSKADTIVVRESNGIAGSSVSVDNIKISVGGKLQGSVSSSAINKIEIRALGGHDYVSLRGGQYDAVSIPATVWGGTGDDVIIGGNGNDTLWGNAGSDNLQGWDGDDFLGGGTAGVDGATVAEKDAFWGGAGFDKFSDGFDFNKWVVNGQSRSDIQQRESPTCQTLATLAAAVTSGISFEGTKITNLGNNNYSVKLYENGKAVTETVNFNGTWSDNDPSPSVDSNGYNNPEFWTILMQRARLEHFYGVNWSTKMTAADWDKANSTHGGTLYNVETAMQQMHGWKTSYSTANKFTGQGLADALQANKLLVAVTDGSGKKKADNGSGIISSHAYAVTKSFKNSSGTWMVEVYNPWGRDTDGTPKDGKDDGYVTLTLAQFQANFHGVATGTH